MDEDGKLTLREALEKFRQRNAAMFSERDLSPEAETFFRCHDTVHVVFGCDTSLFGEGVVKLFTIFGTTLGFVGHLKGYAEADAFSLFRQYSVLHVMRHISRLIAIMPLVVFRAKRMKKPWPWSDHGEYLDRTLEGIRAEFGIRVLRMPD